MAIAALTGPVESRPVDSAPFRAHVRHLLTAVGSTEEALGLIAGVSPSVVHRLSGPGRDAAAAWIAGDVARRLLAVTPAHLADLAGRSVAAAPVTCQLRMLRGTGWSPARMSTEFGVEQWLIDALLDGAVATCSRLIERQITGGMLALRSRPARAAA